MLGFTSKRRKGLLANGKKHPGWPIRQRRNRACDILDMDPPVAVDCLPGRALKGAERHIGLTTADNRIAAHLGGKRMGSIHHMADAFGPQIAGKALGPAKTSHPRGQGLRHRVLRAPRVGEQRIGTGLGQVRRQSRGLTGAAQKEDSRHV